MDSVSHLGPDDLEKRLHRLLGEERSVTVRFLLHLAEFDRRRLFLRSGSKTLWAYCIGELDLPKGQAFRRTRAARLLRRYPAAKPYLLDGRLTMTTFAELKPVLTKQNARKLFRLASRKSREEVRRIVTSLEDSEAGVAEPPPRWVPAGSSAGSGSASRRAATSEERTVVALPDGRFELRAAVSGVFLAKLENAVALLGARTETSTVDALERGLDAILATHKTPAPGLVWEPKATSVVPIPVPARGRRDVEAKVSHRKATPKGADRRHGGGGSPGGTTKARDG